MSQQRPSMRSVISSLHLLSGIWGYTLGGDGPLSLPTADVGGLGDRRTSIALIPIDHLSISSGDEVLSPEAKETVSQKDE
jgi:hypothetical protein